MIYGLHNCTEEFMSYEPVEKILKLAVLMQSNRQGLSIGDIEEIFGVSRRTAERMRDVIVYNFPQTKSRTENNVKYWYIPQGTLKDFIQFSAEELLSVEKTVEFLKNSNMEENARILQDVLDKIRANITDRAFMRLDTDLEVLLEAEGFAHRPGPKIVISPEITENIRQAILSLKQIRIQYKGKYSGKVSSLKLLPYGILYGERNHYLLAKHSDGYDGNNIHYFILSNVLSIEILNEPYKIDSDFSLREWAERSFGVYQEEPFDVEWLFDKSVAEDAKRYVFHPKQTMTENPDGSLTVKFRAGGRFEMDWHLYTWGDSVTVVKPEDWYDGEEE